jgi:pilus assembly protein Flp/PilA
MRTVLHTFWRDEQGATAIEYTLIAALIALVAIVGMVAFANANNGKYEMITSAVTTAGP